MKANFSDGLLVSSNGEDFTMIGGCCIQSDNARHAIGGTIAQIGSTRIPRHRSRDETVATNFHQAGSWVVQSVICAGVHDS